MQDLTKNRNIVSIIEEAREISKLLWEKGWADANSGNFSINITDMAGDIDIGKEEKTGEKLIKKYKHLGNSFILVTRSGSRMRDIAKNPIPELCLLHISKTGERYNNFSLDNERSKKPTSELFTHLELQNLLCEKKSVDRVIMHTHPAEVIAFTHIKKYCREKSINEVLFSIQPEVSFAFPEGIGFVSYQRTGSEKLATETRKKFTGHKIVLWEKHGCVASGKSLSDAFDKTDVLVKSLRIFFLCSSTGNKAEGISVYRIKELKKSAGIK